MINPSIFKTYDIRGTYPEEVNEEVSYRIGQAFVKYLRGQRSEVRSQKSEVNGQILNIRMTIGRDVRDSSLSLSRAFIKGALSQGATIIDLGTVTSSMVYFSVNDDQLDGGAMITASHNPGNYNGIKLIGKGGLPVSPSIVASIIANSKVTSGQSNRVANTVIARPDRRSGRSNPMASCHPEGAIRRSFAKRNKAGSDRRIPRLSGNLVQKDASFDYANYILSFIDPASIKPLKIVLDASGGVAGGIANTIFSQLETNWRKKAMNNRRKKASISKMNFWPHDQYPDHSLNPLLEESQKSIFKEIKKQKADLGIIWDGDGDRAIFFDEKGRFIYPYFMTALLVKIILTKIGVPPVGSPPALAGGRRVALQKKTKIMHDPRLFWLIKEEIEKYGGKFILSKAGRSFFEKRMAQGDILFAAEASGHYYFYKNFCLGDGFIPVLLVLEYLSKIKKPLSSLITPYLKKYFISGEINIKLEVGDRRFENGKKGSNSLSLISNLLSEKYQDGKISHLDGLSVEFPDWHFNLRQSETEPLLRLNIEARSEKLLKKKLKELSSFLL